MDFDWEGEDPVWCMAFVSISIPNSFALKSEGGPPTP